MQVEPPDFESHLDQYPPRVPVRRWRKFLLIPVAALFVGLAIIGLLVEAGVLPDSAVIAGDKDSDSNKELLRSHDILEPGEKIILFYSAGFLSILEEGNLLTDQRAVSYESENAELTIWSTRYREIADVTLASSGGLLEDAKIIVTTDSGQEITLLASTEDGGDKRFLTELKTRWRRASK